MSGLKKRQFQATFPFVAVQQFTVDPASTGTGAQTTTTVTVKGAAVGHLAFASLGVSQANLLVQAFVSAADTVTLVFFNLSGGSIDLASSTVNVIVLQPRVN
jgi:hypothetical protein